LRRPALRSRRWSRHRQHGRERAAAAGQGVEAQRLTARVGRTTKIHVLVDFCRRPHRRRGDPAPARRRSLCLALVNAIPFGRRLTGDPAIQRRTWWISYRPAIISNNQPASALSVRRVRLRDSTVSPSRYPTFRWPRAILTGLAGSRAHTPTARDKASTWSLSGRHLLIVKHKIPAKHCQTARG
jgi:hypothetical protein